jgi:hypothetical protein
LPGGLLALTDLELHPLAFIEAAEPAGVDPGVVHEHVHTLHVDLDEPEALLAVEPQFPVSYFLMLLVRTWGHPRSADNPADQAPARSALSW